MTAPPAPPETAAPVNECGWVHWPTEEDADAEGWCNLPAGHEGEHREPPEPLL
jgi:hypothetical protein